MVSILEWAAPVIVTLAALMTAANLGTRITGWGFVVFLVGSIVWTALGIITGQMPVVVQNLVLSLLNLFGVWRWLGRQASIEDGGKAAHEESAAAPSETLFPVSRLTNGSVVAQGGKPLGQAIDAMAGCGSGRIAYVVVGVGGVAGVGETYRRVEWRDVAVDGDTIRLQRDSIDDLPELEKDNWPGR